MRLEKGLTRDISNTALKREGMAGNDACLVRDILAHSGPSPALLVSDEVHVLQLKDITQVLWYGRRASYLVLRRSKCIRA